MSLSGEVSEQQERSLSGPILSVDVPHWKKKTKGMGQPSQVTMQEHFML